MAKREPPRGAAPSSVSWLHPSRPNADLPRCHVARLWVEARTVAALIVELKTLYIVVYGVLPPLNVTDHMVHTLRRDRFLLHSKRLLDAIRRE